MSFKENICHLKSLDDFQWQKFGGHFCSMSFINYPHCVQLDAPLRKSIEGNTKNMRKKYHSIIGNNLQHRQHKWKRNAMAQRQHPTAPSASATTRNYNNKKTKLWNQLTIQWFHADDGWTLPMPMTTEAPRGDHQHPKHATNIQICCSQSQHQHLKMAFVPCPMGKANVQHRHDVPTTSAECIRPWRTILDVDYTMD